VDDHAACAAAAQTLCLRACGIGSDTAHVLLDAMLYNWTLLHVHVEYNTIAAGVVRRFVTAVAASASVRLMARRCVLSLRPSDARRRGLREAEPSQRAALMRRGHVGVHPTRASRARWMDVRAGAAVAAVR
jgi:hypothetical protein